MRFGFTTGSCAAAAAKAAAYMLLFGVEKKKITIETPKCIPYEAEILDICRQERQVSCAVRKDGGDDPDVTSGILIYAAVSMEDSVAAGEGLPHITLDGGIGVGRVTKPGLDQPVGNAAINHVPREMIIKEVGEVCRQADYQGSISVCIYVPDGEAIAQKTFNPRLGIEGGISIIGTSGIVEPMSHQALLDTIRVELNQRKVLGFDYVAVSPGNYGLDYMRQAYHYDLNRSVKCSNFIGDTIDMAKELGFSHMLITGHIGKLIKVAGGILNTHSKEGDCRMELLAAAAIRKDVPLATVQKLLDCIATEEAVRLLQETGRLHEVMEYVMNRIMFYLNKRAGDSLKVECILYANKYGELAKSKGAEKWLTLLVQEQEQLI